MGGGDINVVKAVIRMYIDTLKRQIIDIEGLNVCSLNFWRGVEGVDLRRSERRLKR